jgi:hypothetical protein
MTHILGALLLAAGAAVVVLDLVVGTSTGPRSTLLRLRVGRTLPHLSPGLAVVLVCAAGTAVFAAGLDLLRA